MTTRRYAIPTVSLKPILILLEWSMHRDKLRIRWLEVIRQQHTFQKEGEVVNTLQQLLGKQFLRLIVLLVFAVTAFGASSRTASAEDLAITPLQQEEANGIGAWKQWNVDAVLPSCRYGVSASATGANFLTDVGIGWVVTFGAIEPTWLPDGIDHTPMIRLKQAKSGSTYLSSYTVIPALTDAELGAQIDANPGALWIVGNEVDRVGWQDDLMPEMYATAYHDVYHYIKNRDPSARVAVSGLVQVTPGRLQYLDKVLAAYRSQYGTRPPVDVWTFHAYIFPERVEDYNGESGTPIYAWIANGTDRNLAIKKPSDKRPISEQRALCARDDYSCVKEHDDPALFQKQVVDMRRWMKNNGYQNVPLILTEWSQLFWYIVDQNNVCNILDEDGNCFTPQRVTTFMERTLDYLETATDKDLGYPLDNHRLVQQWAWYAMDTMGADIYTDGNPSLLVNRETTALTQMGQKYKQRIAQSTKGAANLLIEQVSGDVIAPGGNGKIGIVIRNNGASATTQPFLVEFFSDQAQTQKIGEVTVPAGLEGCAIESVVAELTWNSLETGVYRFWGAVDRARAIAGDDPADNEAQGIVIATDNRIQLPIITR